MKWPKPSRRYAEYVRKIACDEWTFVEIARNSEVVIQHASGVTAAYGTHDGGNDQNGPRNFAADVQRACGCRLIEPRGRKRSRKADQVTDFSIGRAARESSRWHETCDQDIADLNAKRDHLIAECQAAAASGKRDQIRQIAQHLQVIAAIEALLLDRYHQPVDPFDPYSLGSSA